MKSVLKYHRELDRAVRHGFHPTEEGIEAHRIDVQRRVASRQKREFEKRRAIERAEAKERELARMSSGMDAATAQGMVNAQLQAMAAIKQYPSQYNGPRYGMTQAEIEQCARELLVARSSRK
jgi:hypothetical protein